MPCSGNISKDASVTPDKTLHRINIKRIRAPYEFRVFSLVIKDRFSLLIFSNT